MSRRPIRLQFYGYFSAWNSMSNICRQYAKELSQSVSDIGLEDASRFDASWHAYAGYEGARQISEGSGIMDKALKPFEGCDPNAPVGFFYGTPEEAWPKLKGHAYKVGGFVCETDRIPHRWVEVCNRLDQIYVPSHFCAQAFQLSGVRTPIKIVRHGLEDEFTPNADKILSEPFIFFNTFSVYSFPERKGCEELIRCFLKAFPGHNDVVLRLRTHSFGPIAEYRRKYHFGDQVQIIPYHFGTLEDVAQMLRAVHCTVHPSKGEGFGLIPFQSIACETPVIAPCATGMAEYISMKTAMPLRIGRRIRGPSWDNQPGCYYAVDEDHLIHLLRHARENWSFEYQKVRIAGEEFRCKYRWSNVLRPVMQDMLDVIQRY